MTSHNMTPLEASDNHKQAMKEAALAKKVYELAKCELEEAQANALLGIQEVVEKDQPWTKKYTLPEKEALVVIDPTVKKWKRTVAEERFNFDNAQAEATAAQEVFWISYSEAKLPIIGDSTNY